MLPGCLLNKLGGAVAQFKILPIIDSHVSAPNKGIVPDNFAISVQRLSDCPVSTAGPGCYAILSGGYIGSNLIDTLADYLRRRRSL